MSDLISRQAAIDALEKIPVREFKKTDGLLDALISIGQVYMALKQLPSAQPERKKGKWKMALVKDLIGFNTVCFRCSECNCMEYSTSPFCRMCGAKMGEGEQE